MLHVYQLILLACADEPVPRAPDSGADTAPESPCDAGMVQVDAFCIDAWEPTITGERGNVDQGAGFPDGSTTALSEALPGVVPTTNVSWYQSWAICDNAGKHLCTVLEWQQACGAAVFPWGDAPEAAEVCAVEGAAYTALQPTGSLPDCRGPTGIHDQIGNAWEWADPVTTLDDGTPLTAKLGGAWYAGAGNALCPVPPFSGHPPEFEGTIVGRCCAAAR